MSVELRARARLLAIVACLLARAITTSPAMAASPASPPLPAHAPDSSVGVVNCASSLCHGSITPWKGSGLLRNEYVTWSRLDKHALAYSVLLGERSKRIAANVGLRVPPQQARQCLDCHTHNVPAAQRGERFKLSDGVSCEACHGPAGRWAASHVEQGASHADNLRHGLFPAEDNLQRARLCLSCHLGNADKLVNHRLMAAGHPRLSFELETFSQIEPSHYRIDADYLQRKPGSSGVKTWAIGQALAVEQMMDLLLDPKRGHDGMFPELVLFDCHACHHPMSKRQWQPRRAFAGAPGNGVVRLNDSGMLMLRAIAAQLDPQLGARVSRQVVALQRAAAGDGDSQAQARALRRLAGDIAARVQAQDFSDRSLRGIALRLVDDGLAGNYSDYAGAEQAAMAIGSVVSVMHRQGVLGATAPLNAGLSRLNASLSDDENYRPAVFRQRLRDFRALLVSR